MSRDGKQQALVMGGTQQKPPVVREEVGRGRRGVHRDPARFLEAAAWGSPQGANNLHRETAGIYNCHPPRQITQSNENTFKGTLEQRK